MRTGWPCAARAGPREARAREEAFARGRRASPARPRNRASGCLAKARREDLLERGGGVAPPPAQRYGRSADHGDQDVEVVVAPEGELAREGVVEQHGHGEQVAPLGDGAAAHRLLGRHEGERADEGAGAVGGHPVSRVHPRLLGEAQVEDHRGGVTAVARAPDEDVVGREVPVDEPGRVQGREAGEDLICQAGPRAMGSGPWLRTRAPSVAPLSSSMAKKGRPSSSRPAPIAETTLGWSTRSACAASRSKRRTMPASPACRCWSTFTASGRPLEQTRPRTRPRSPPRRWPARGAPAPLRRPARGRRRRSLQRIRLRARAACAAASQSTSGVTPGKIPTECLPNARVRASLMDAKYGPTPTETDSSRRWRVNHGGRPRAHPNPRGDVDCRAVEHDGCATGPKLAPSFGGLSEVGAGEGRRGGSP